MKFTHLSIQKLKAKEDRYDVLETGGRGFGVRVTKKGTKTWIFLYRFEGRPRRMTLGRVEDLPLVEARERCEEARKLLRAGTDPGQAAKTQKRINREAPTVEDIVDEYLTRWAQVRKVPDSAKEDERMLRKDLIPLYGSWKAKDVTRKDILRLLDGMLKRGATVTTNRTYACIRKCFGWAVENELIPSSPCINIRPPAPEKPRERVLSEPEIKVIWHGLDKTNMSDLTRLCLKLQFATGARKGECVNLEWRDISGDWWTLPSSKVKNKQAHRVPLNPIAKLILDQANKLSNGKQWVFPSPRGDKPMGATAVDFAVRRNRQILGNEWSPHDIRRTVASMMALLGVDQATISKCLNHVQRDITSRHYNQYQYDSEKREALDRWGRKLKEIIED